MAKPTLDPPPPAVMERAEHPALAGFHEPLRAWFAASYAVPTAPQELGWPVIASGENCLLLAPTGSGKTLAAFLSAIDRLMFTPLPPKGERCRVLYVSPLKARATLPETAALLATCRRAISVWSRGNVYGSAL